MKECGATLAILPNIYLPKGRDLYQPQICGHARTVNFLPLHGEKNSIIFKMKVLHTNAGALCEFGTSFLQSN